MSCELNIGVASAGGYPSRETVAVRLHPAASRGDWLARGEADVG